jgi:hypothetical protein
VRFELFAAFDPPQPTTGAHAGCGGSALAGKRQRLDRLNPPYKGTYAYKGT